MRIYLGTLMLTGGAGAGLIGIPAQSVIAAQEYAIIPMVGTECPTEDSYASAINEDGVVVGAVCTYSKMEGFWYYNGAMHQVHTPEQFPTAGFTAVNNVGAIVGRFYDFDAQTGPPFLYSQAAQKLLPMLDDHILEIQDINDYGIAVGLNRDLSIDNSWRACCWINGELQFLPRLPTWNPEDDFFSGANAISRQGEIVGFCDFEGRGAPVRWVHGQIERLWMPDRITVGSASCINEVGQIGGSIDFEHSYTSNHPAVWDAPIHGIHRLDSPYGQDPTGTVLGINNWHDAVGTYTSYFIEEPFFAFISEDYQLLTPLLDRLPPLHKWYLYEAWDINDSGQIVGLGYDSDFATQHGFLMTPVYPAFTLESPTPGTAGTANTFRATGLTPGEKVRFFYSNHGGGAVIPGCDLQIAALQLDDPRELGGAVADANGVAEITRFVPASAAEKTAIIQVCSPSHCIISNYVVETFE